MHGKIATATAGVGRLVTGLLLVACVTAPARAFTFGEIDPLANRQAIFGGLVIFTFLLAVAVWLFSALRRLRRRFRRRMHFMATALNYMNHGVSMVDRYGRLTFCNDAYL